MRLAWPFRRLTAAGGPAEEAGVPDAVAGERASKATTARPAWRDLPPVQRTVGAPPLVAPNRPFKGGLAGAQLPPPILRRLAHDVSPDAPKGLIGGIAAARPIRPPTGGSPLPQPARPTHRLGRWLQRVAGRGEPRSSEPEVGSVAAGTIEAAAGQPSTAVVTTDAPFGIDAREPRAASPATSPARDSGPAPRSTIAPGRTAPAPPIARFTTVDPGMLLRTTKASAAQPPHATRERAPDERQPRDRLEHAPALGQAGTRRVIQRTFAGPRRARLGPPLANRPAGDRTAEGGSLPQPPPATEPTEAQRASSTSHPEAEAGRSTLAPLPLVRRVDEAEPSHPASATAPTQPAGAAPTPEAPAPVAQPDTVASSATVNRPSEYPPTEYPPTSPPSAPPSSPAASSEAASGAVPLRLAGPSARARGPATDLDASASGRWTTTDHVRPTGPRFGRREGSPPSPLVTTRARPPAASVIQRTAQGDRRAAPLTGERPLVASRSAPALAAPDMSAGYEPAPRLPPVGSAAIHDTAQLGDVPPLGAVPSATPLALAQPRGIPRDDAGPRASSSPSAVAVSRAAADASDVATSRAVEGIPAPSRPVAPAEAVSVLRTDAGSAPQPAQALGERELEELLGKLYPKLRIQLSRELLVARERSGSLIDVS